MKKNCIKNLIDLEEKDGLKNTIKRLKKRYNYLKSKAHMGGPTNQMKYISFHLKKLGAKP